MRANNKASTTRSGLYYYIQLVTPSDVPSAVRTLISICTTNFHVSFFMIDNFFG